MLGAGRLLLDLFHDLRDQLLGRYDRCFVELWVDRVGWLMVSCRNCKSLMLLGIAPWVRLDLSRHFFESSNRVICFLLVGNGVYFLVVILDFLEKLALALIAFCECRLVPRLLPVYGDLPFFLWCLPLEHLGVLCTKRYSSIVNGSIFGLLFHPFAFLRVVFDGERVWMQKLLRHKLLDLLLRQLLL